MALTSYGNQTNQKPSILDAIILQGIGKTPFLDWVGRGSIAAPKHSWILDRYADAGENANLEITDIDENTTDTKYMKDNVVQIIKTDYGISDEENQNAKYGQQEWGYRTAKKGKEHAKDIEFALLGLHNASVFDPYTVGTPTTEAKMAGIFHYVPAEHRQQFDTNGDGTGTVQTFTMDMLSTMLQPMWERGGFEEESFTMVVGPVIKRSINAFAGEDFLRPVEGQKRFDPTLYRLDTDFGAVNVKLHTQFASAKLSDKVFVGKLNEIKMMNKIATYRKDLPTSKTAKFGRYYTSFTVEMKNDDMFACASGLK